MERRVLAIGGRVLFGITETIIVFAMLIRTNTDTAQIIATLGLIYCAIRWTALAMSLSIARLTAALDVIRFELRGEQRPSVEAMMSQRFEDFSISAAFVGLICGMCIYHFFVRF